MQSLFEANASAWVKQTWKDCTAVEIVPPTWERGFDWQQVMEGNISQQAHDIVFHNGISWKVADVKLQQPDPIFSPETVYLQTYTAPPDSLAVDGERARMLK